MQLVSTKKDIAEEDFVMEDHVLSKNELVIVAKMLDNYMRVNILTFSNKELDAGWKFLACYLPNSLVDEPM